MEHPPTRGTSRCAPGAFSLTAPVFRSSRAQKEAWCARDSTWAAGPGAHGESTILRQARSQPHHQRQKPHTNHITNAKNRAPIKPAAPATLHTNQYQPQQPHHQQQKPHTNHITNTRNRAPIKPAATATPHINRSNRSTSTRSHTPTTSPAPRVNASCTATGRRRTFP